MTEQHWLNEESLRLCLDCIGEIGDFRGFISEGEHGFYLESINRKERQKYNIEDGDIILIRMSPTERAMSYTINLGDR